MKRYIVEKTNRAKIRPEEQSEKTKNCRENLWNEIRSKGPQRQKRTQKQNVKGWASSVDFCQRHKPQHAHHVKVSRGDI